MSYETRKISMANIQLLKDKLLDIMSNYCVVLKLQKIDVEFNIIDEDSGVYDSWDWPSSSCYSIEIRSSDSNSLYKFYMKTSINESDGECVLELFNNSNNTKKGEYLNNEYDINSNKFRGHVYCDEKTYYHKCLIYTFDSDLFFKIIEEYLRLA